MAFKDLFRNQLSKVIEWKPQASNVVWWKFPNSNDEIKNASKLIVSPGQGALLVYEGKIADVIVEPGTFALATDNHPFITTLVNLRQNFESEHKLYVYYFRTADMVNIPFGTPQPLKYNDSVYQFPVELGVYGNFSCKIVDIKKLYIENLAQSSIFYTDDLKSMVNSRITPVLSQIIARQKWAFNHIDAMLYDISMEIKQSLVIEFQNFGLEILDFRIIGTQFDEETYNRIGRIADVSADVVAANEAGLDYVALEKLRALRDAARNEGGIAGVGAQLGAGMEISKLYDIKKEEMSSTNPNDDAVNQLRKIKLLLDEDLITQAEFEAKKKDILNKL